MEVPNAILTRAIQGLSLCFIGSPMFSIAFEVKVQKGTHSMRDSLLAAPEHGLKATFHFVPLKLHSEAQGISNMLVTKLGEQ